jgi:hypothetical protein
MDGRNGARCSASCGRVTCSCSRALLTRIDCLARRPASASYMMPLHRSRNEEDRTVGRLGLRLGGVECSQGGIYCLGRCRDRLLCCESVQFGPGGMVRPRPGHDASQTLPSEHACLTLSGGCAGKPIEVRVDQSIDKIGCAPCGEESIAFLLHLY